VLLYSIIILSIFFNYYWLVNNEVILLSILLLSFFFLIYIFMGLLIKLYFISKTSNVLNILKTYNVIDLYLDKLLYQNIITKKYFLKNVLKIKDKLINVLIYFNQKINNFLLSNIFSFFLNLKKNFYKLSNNKKLLIFRNNIKRCEIIL